MSYDESTKKATMKYIKDKQQEIKLRYKKDEYEQEILPAIEESGLPVATYIKQAVFEKITSDVTSDYELGKVLGIVKDITVKDIPAALHDDCRQIILYGSCARGNFNDDSDVDIAILTECDRVQAKKYTPQLDDIAAKIGMDTMAVVNFVCLPLKEFNEKKGWYPYFMNIERDGIILYEH